MVKGKKITGTRRNSKASRTYLPGQCIRVASPHSAVARLVEVVCMDGDLVVVCWQGQKYKVFRTEIM